MADPVLTFTTKSAAPLGILAASKIAGVALKLVADEKLPKDASPTLAFSKGEELSGVASILRYLARAGDASKKLYGADALEACQVDQWLDYLPLLVPGAGLEGACASANDFLSLRTFLVGYALTVADVGAWGQLEANLQWPKLRARFPHLARWFAACSVLPALAETADAHGIKRRAPGAAGKTAKTADGQEVALGGGHTGSFDVGLVGAEMGKVVTRFPPEPSGFLHIGHAKAALLNQFLADAYKGRLLVRFDDTNPSKEKDEYVESIVADLRTLGLKFETITYTSDYFPQLRELGERLVRAGHLYADDTPVEQMREERMVGKESVRRGRPVEENLRLFGEMFEGTEEGLRNCLRLKLDMTAGNTALRDPVAFRCNLTPHWRTGTTYKCYPTYDFACPFVDSFEGVTHALRTSEYKDREAQFYWVLKLQQAAWPGLPHVHMWDYARLSFVHTVLSKRKLTWFVENGLVEGWNDPRMPTVQGMLRRGLTLQALREFIIEQGASKNVTVQEWDKIWSANKRVIDPVCPRHTAVESLAAVRVHLANGPRQQEEAVLPRHPKNPNVGTKRQIRTKELWIDQADAASVEEGEEVTLMGWGNAIFRKLHWDAASGAVTAIDADLHLEGDFKKTRLKLTWLAAQPAACPTLELHFFAPLLTKRKLEEGDDFEAAVNRDTLTIVAAVGDVNMRDVKQGDTIQLERKGYFKVDVAADPAHPDAPMILFNIPDGRAKGLVVPGAPTAAAALPAAGARRAQA